MVFRLAAVPRHSPQIPLNGGRELSILVAFFGGADHLIKAVLCVQTSLNTFSQRDLLLGVKQSDFADLFQVRAN